MKGGGRPQAVSSGASPAAELPLWSQLIPACPIPLGRLKLIQAASCLCVNLSILRKFPHSVDTERRNGYNTYRVRPKRSAVDTVLELPYLGNNRPDDSRAVIYVGTL